MKKETQTLTKSIIAMINPWRMVDVLKNNQRLHPAVFLLLVSVFYFLNIPSNSFSQEEYIVEMASNIFVPLLVILMCWRVYSVQEIFQKLFFLLVPVFFVMLLPVVILLSILFSIQNTEEFSGYTLWISAGLFTLIESFLISYFIRKLKK